MLPLELIHLAINQLIGDQITLKNCSLVCKAWKDQSQAVLFEATSLRIGADTGPKVAQLMGTAAHLKSIIKGVEVALDPPLVSEAPEMADTLEVLTLFSRVRTLHVLDRSVELWVGAWVSKHLCHLLSLPSLQTVSFVGIRLHANSSDTEFLELLRHAPSLENVEFIDVLIRRSYEPDRTMSTSVASRRGLRNLTILPHNGAEDQVALQWLLSPFNLTMLTGLCISHGEPYLHEILGSMSALERLIITSEESDHSDSPVNLSRNSKTLLNIVVKFYPGINDYFSPHIPIWLSETLGTLSAPNIVARLQFTIFVDIPDLPLLPFPLVAWVDAWLDLGRCLATDRFPQLKRLKLSTLNRESEAFRGTLWSATAINYFMVKAIKSSFVHNTPPFIIETHHGLLPSRFP